MTTEELFLGKILEFSEIRETVGSVASDLCFEFNMQRPESLLQIQVYSDIR